MLMLYIKHLWVMDGWANAAVPYFVKKATDL